MEESKGACLTFYKRANKKFIGLRSGLDDLNFAEGLRDVWTAFDGLLNYKGYTGSNKDKREKLSKDYQKIFQEWNKTSTFNESMGILISLSPVINMENGKSFSLTKESELKEILNFTYVPRGNLNHGSKDLERKDSIGERNRNLVEHSFKIVHELLQMILIKENLI